MIIFFFELGALLTNLFRVSNWYFCFW